MCRDSEICVCAYQCLGCDILRHPRSQGVHHYQHCHHHRVLLFPGGAETANITPPRPSTLSLDCTLNTMCHLDVLMPSASALKCKESDVGDSNETGRLRQAHTHTLKCTSGGKMQSFPAPVHTREHVLYPHSRVSRMELI